MSSIDVDNNNKYSFYIFRLSKLSYQPSQDQSHSVDNTASTESKPPLPTNHHRSNVASTTTKSSHRRISSFRFTLKKNKTFEFIT
jgi:hypothetical protein